MNVRQGLGRGRNLALGVLCWRVVVPHARRRARRRLQRLIPGGVTIVTVNWNARPYLEVLLAQVRRRSPPGTRVLVVDNASRDGSRALVRAQTDVRWLGLPVNAGHDVALDLGFLSVETEYVVALDVDAFPLRDDWLARLLEPLDAGTQVSGARLNREYVHPCCLAMRTARFVERSHSFRSRYRPRSEGRDASGDIGETISAHEPAKYFFDPTSQRGPGDVGTVFGGIVYHNFYSTRFRATRDGVLDDVVAPDDPARAWAEARARYEA
jgi:glycosyltransferase involved in cell wall biosynthesis